MKTELPNISVSVKNKIEKLKSIVSKHFGNRFKYFILYGSYARGDYNKSSDIDILIVLDNIRSEMEEIDTLAELKTDILLDSDIYISTNPTSVNKFKNSNLFFYRNIRKEGVII